MDVNRFRGRNVISFQASVARPASAHHLVIAFLGNCGFRFVKFGTWRNCESPVSRLFRDEWLGSLHHGNGLCFFEFGPRQCTGAVDSLPPERGLALRRAHRVRESTGCEIVGVLISARLRVPRQILFTHGETRGREVSETRVTNLEVRVTRGARLRLVYFFSRDEH